MVKTVQIVSLSRGIIGESFVEHEMKLGVSRLESMGLKVTFSEHALKGIDYIKEHPDKRALDLIEAYKDPEVDMVLCAIGGDDTYRLLPYLFENDELKSVVNDKVFLGFSDTTMNHLMLHKLGVKTFYGQSFLADVCELDKEMLPYSKAYLEELIRTGSIREIRPSDVWYEERKGFGPEQMGTPRVEHPNTGFELLQGNPVFEGEILGGCIDTIYDIFDNSRYADSVELCKKYGLFPSLEEWKGKILLLETSEERATPTHYRKMLEALKAYEIFDVVSGVLVGKPVDEFYMAEYKTQLTEVIDNPKLSVICNVNIGHATPRCIIPFGVKAVIDAEKQRIRFLHDI